MNAKVLFVQKAALVIPVRCSVFLHFFRNGRRVFAKILGNLLEGKPLI
jgi:hypothetical protein